jgi:hypothetical protein
MGSFKEEYDKRLRRICNVTDDTLRVTEDSKTVYEGYCETCRYSEEVIEINVWNGNTVVTSRQFYDMGELIRAMDRVTL